MRAWLIVACVCVMLVVAAGSWAQDIAEASGGVVPAAVTAVAVARSVGNNDPIKPWIHSSMPKRVSAKLKAGFELAVDRVRKIGSCSGLFTELGTDGLEILATGLYFPVDSYRREIEVCGRNAAANSRGGENLAYTTVGGAPTWISRHFSRVPTETAAVVVIHEALHHAGLSERPHDRMAMSSVEITEMVKAACEFSSVLSGRYRLLVPPVKGTHRTAASTSSTARVASTGGLFPSIQGIDTPNSSHHAHRNRNGGSELEVD